MSIIYKPKGRAAEYSPLAANLYTGCNHGCTYCYAKKMSHRFGATNESWNNPIPKENVVKQFEIDCEKRKGGDCPQVLFCFMCDPYCKIEQDQQITRHCLEIAYNYNIPISILTKSDLCLKDMDLFRKFDRSIQVGFTLTFNNDEDSLKYEPGASLPKQRVSTIRYLHKNKIKTWVSFEPVIYPKQTLNLIECIVPYVDHVKIGKLNGDLKEKEIDWNAFLHTA